MHISFCCFYLDVCVFMFCLMVLLILKLIKIWTDFIFSTRLATDPESNHPSSLAERHPRFLSVFHSRWDVTVSYQFGTVPGTQRCGTHTHERARWDGWACQSAEQTAAQSSAAWLSPTTAWLTLQALQSAERISLHLHRKDCHGFHFSISLCTYIHLLINPHAQISHANMSSKRAGSMSTNEDRK